MKLEVNNIDKLIQELEQVESEDIEVHKFINGILEDKTEGVKIDRRNFSQLKGQLRKNKTRIRILRSKIKREEKEERIRNHQDLIAKAKKERLEREVIRQTAIKERNASHDHQFIQSLKNVLTEEYGKEKQYELFITANKEMGDE